MSKPGKIISVVIGGVLGFFLLATIGLMVFVDASQFKSRVETAAADLLQMDLLVEGTMGVKLFPGLHLSLNDVRLLTQGVEVASAQELALWIELWPLLQREVRIKEVSLTEPVITITGNGPGIYTSERTDSSPDSRPGLSLPHLSLTGASLDYVDEQAGQDFRARECHLDVYDLYIANEKNTDPDNKLNFTAELDCGEIHADGFQISDLKIAAEKDAAELNLRPITLQVFAAQGSAEIRADFSAAAPQYQLEFSLPQFPIEAFLNTLAHDKPTEQLALGKMDFSANLSLQGRNVEEIMQNAQGHFSLRGAHLTLNGTDLDQQFAEFESSQHFNLVDVGALFYAGPLGLVLTKGYDFSGILRGAGGHTEITALVSEWQMANGVAKAVDVAMATRQNRVAMQGELDFVNGRYRDVVVALIDGDGCVLARQEIDGEFRNPVVKEPSILQSLAGPMMNLLENVRDLFPGGECEVFYAGTVAPPK